MRALCALLALTCSACLVDLQPLEGRACSAEHPCPDGLYCHQLRCTSEATPQPRYDDGGLVWEQAVAGFSSTDVYPGARAQVDRADSNRLRVDIAAPGADRALAQAERDALPQRDDGMFGGTLRLVSAGMPRDVEFTFANLETADGQPVVELYFIPDSHGLGLRSTLRPTLIWNGFGPESFPAVAPLYVSGRDNQIAVRWRHNQYVELSVNSERVERFDLPTGGIAPGARLAARLQLGVLGCSACAADAGLSLEYRGWKVSGDADAL
ncbi:MAG: hypothetical protein IPJ65_19030 [Archangiaceae bacterium]|nr:hypothetical protein [Archangiaceae bacterium]